MPGGTHHWVLGTSNTICVGRHFYSASTIRPSVVTIVHTFLHGGALTNENLLETRTFLYQLIVFWSMRLDKTDVDGKLIIKNHCLLLILLQFRGSYPWLFFRGGILRCLIPRHFYHPLIGIWQSLLCYWKSSCQCRRRDCPRETTFLLSFTYLLKAVYHSLGRRGRGVFIYFGSHAGWICCCRYKSLKGHWWAEWQTKRRRGSRWWGHYVFTHWDDWRHSQGISLRNISLLFPLLGWFP